MTFYKAQGTTLRRVQSGVKKHVRPDEYATPNSNPSLGPTVLIRARTIRRGVPIPYTHKFGINYTGFSRVQCKEDVRISPEHYPTEMWDKMRPAQTNNDTAGFSNTPTALGHR